MQLELALIVMLVIMQIVLQVQLFASNVQLVLMQPRQDQLAALFVLLVLLH